MMKINKNNIKVTIYGILLTIGVIIFSYGCWQAERYINYKWSYKSEVEETIKPLIIKINELEKRIKILENSK